MRSSKVKHLFVVSSWYPTRQRPSQGIFVQEQHRAFAALFSEWHTTIASWNADTCLSLRSMPSWPRQIIRHWRRAPHALPSVLGNLYEGQSDILRVSHRLGGTKILALQVKSTVEAQFLQARETFGPVDVIHAHAIWPGGLAAYHLAKEYGIPLVITEHTSPFPIPWFLDKSGHLREDFVRAYRQAHVVTVPSTPHMAALQKSGVADVTVLPNMVDERFFQPGNDLDDGVFRFLSIAVDLADPRKNIKTLLEAFFCMVERQPESQRRRLFLHLGGDASKAGDMVSWTRSHNLHKQVLWLGPLSRERVRDELQRCHCLVVPSLAESFGMTCAEAISCGRPVIATRCGGPEDVIAPPVGIVVDDGKRGTLQEALFTMSQSGRQYRSEDIRAYFLQRFSSQVVLSQLEKIYKRCLEDPNPSRRP